MLSLWVVGRIDCERNPTQSGILPRILKLSPKLNIERLTGRVGQHRGLGAVFVFKVNFHDLTCYNYPHIILLWRIR